MNISCPYVLRFNKEDCSVDIVNGRLIIKNSSGILVNESWLSQHRSYILKEIATLTQKHIFQYVSYSADRFGEKNTFNGIALQFIDYLTGGSACRHYNADLTHARATKVNKKGDRFKNKNDFRVGNNHKIARDWLAWGLKPPTRWAALKDYMGNMKVLAFTGAFSNGEFLFKESVQLIDVSNDEIHKLLDSEGIQDKHAFELDFPSFGSEAEKTTIHANQTTPQQADDSHISDAQGPHSSHTSAVQEPYSGRTSAVQHTDNTHTRTTHKDMANSLCTKGFQDYSGAGEINHGLRYKDLTEKSSRGATELRVTVEELTILQEDDMSSAILLELEAHKEQALWLDKLNANLVVGLPYEAPPWEES